MPRARSILAAALLTAAAACGDEGPNISGVDPATIARIEISPRVDTILIADTIQARDTVRLHALVYGNDGELREGVRLAWASLDSTVAVPDANGVVTAVGVGTTQVQASAGKFDRATVVVLRAARTVAVSPSLATATGQLLVDDPIRAGDTLRLRAVARDEAGAVVPGVTWTWTSSAPSVATVDAGGLVTARGLGQANVTAATTDLGGETISSSYQVMVTPLVQQVTVRGLPARAVVGDTIQLSPETYGRSGQLLHGRTYQWTSSDVNVAAVGATGRVIVLAPGRFTITARTGFVTGTALAGTPPTVSVVDVLPRVFTRLDAGGDFTCAAISLDRPYCFGLNDQAQLANVTSDTTCIDEFADDRPAVDCSLVPLRVAGGRAFTRMTAGGAHACGLEADGLAYCWGSGEEGARGDGTTSTSEVAKLVTGAQRFTSISAGGLHTCALTAGGAAWCWGDDRFGQLGNFKRASSTTPIPVEGGLTFSQIATGMRHTCAVRSSGETYCWGDNADGQLGDGTLARRDTAVPVAGFGFVQVTAGENFSCGLTSAGAAYCWGQGDGYQLGRASTEGSSSPIAVSGGVAFTAISAGGTHACALAAGGQVYCWGTFRLDHLGSEIFGQSPQPVAGATGMVAVTAGRRHACALRDDGTAWCWGSNVLGPFGDALQALWRPRLVDPIVLP